MAVSKYYPALSEIVKTDDLPESLNFIKGGVTRFFDKMFYKDLSYSKSIKGDSAFYSLSIVSRKRLDIELPGTGIFIVLNPDFEDGDISSFPITVFYDWKILAYKRYFSLSNFSFSIEDTFNLLLDLLDVSEEQVLGLALRMFVVPASPAVSQIEQFTADLNLLFGTSVAVPAPSDHEISDLVFAINQQVNESAFFAVLSLYILPLPVNDQSERLDSFFSSFLPTDIESYLKNLFTPTARATFELSAGIEFPRNILQPVYDEVGINPYDPGNAGDPLTVIPEDSDGNPKVLLKFGEALFYADTELGLGYSMELVLSTNVPAQIGKTGLVIDFQNIKVDLSRTTNIPEATADGRPLDFIGAYITEAEITLPAKWFKNQNGNTLGIYARNLLVGTGGISGKIGLEVVGSPGVKPTGGAEMLFTLGKKDDNDPTDNRKGFALGFQSFELEFQQNELIHSEIKGSLHLPAKFDNPNAAPGTSQTIEIEAHFEKDGDFSVTATRAAGVPLRLPEVFTYTLTELEVGKDDGRAYLQTSGDLKFEGLLGNFLKDPLKIQELTIYSDGGFEIKGGTIPLSDSVRLPLGPVEIYVTAIHLGAHEQMHNGHLRQYKYFGFDGGVSVDPGGVDARGDGIKFYFTADDKETGLPHHSFLKIESLSIDLIIPGTASADSATLILQGYLSLKEKEYAGSIKFSLPKAKLAGGAGMKYNKEYPAFLVDAFVELSTGIPLGQTSLGIFGFRGLFGLRYIASKDPGETWTDYYRKPTKGVNIQKMDTPDETVSAANPFSIGAGISLATIFDDGKTFSSQLFLLLSIPNLILLEGRANIMGKRIGLDSTEEPQFYAVIAYAPGDSVMLGFGADFFVPKDGADKGKVLKLKAAMEAAYFFKNSKAWYVNFGTKAKPIQAEIISLFDGYSYLMLSASGIEAGAGVHFKFEKKYLGGTLRAVAEAYFDVWGKISFERPKQIGGGIGVGGYVDVSILGFGFYISLDCILTVETPKPFRVAGSVELCVVVKLLVKKLQKCFTVEFVWEKNNQIDTAPISALGGGLGGTPEARPVQGFHLGSGKMYPVHYFGTTVPTTTLISNVVPTDTPVEVLFEKALLPASTLSARIGGFTNPAENYIEMIPPAKGDRQVSHERMLEDFSMEIWNGSAWQTYHPYTALTDDPTEQAAMQNFKSVYWQKTSNEYNKLRFPAQSPFAYVDAGQPSWYTPEEMGLTASTLWCSGKGKVKTCVTDFGTGLSFTPGTAYSKKGLTWTPLAKEAAGMGSLVLNAPGSVEFLFPQPVESFEIRLQTNATGVFIHYYEELRDPVTLQRTGFQLLATVWRDRATFDFNTPFIVHSPSPYIAKMVVEPAHGDEQLMNQLLIEIDTLQNQIYTDPNLSPEQVKAIEHQILIKQGQWQLEKARGCNIPLDGEALTAYQQALESQIANCEAQQNQLDGLVLELCKTCDCCCCDKSPASAPPNPAPPATDPRNCCEAILAVARQRRTCYALEQSLQGQLTQKGKERKLNPAGNQLAKCREELARLQKLSDQLCASKCSCCHDSQTPAPGTAAPSPALLPPNPAEIKTCCDAIAAAAANLQLCLQLEQQLQELLQQIANAAAGGSSAEGCYTFILSVCWINWQDYQYNINIPEQAAIQEDYELMVAAMQKTFAPIWRPNSTFRIGVKISDKVNNGSPQSETHYFGFKTGGPLGFYNESDIKPALTPVNNSNPNNDFPPQKPTPDMPENQLKFYIDFDRSYPNADGRILYAKPLYYKDPVFNIFYKQQFAHHFFARWADVGSYQEKYTLETFIQDPVQAFDGTTASAIKVETETVPVEDLLGANTQEVDLMNAMTSIPSNCISTGGDPIKPPKQYTQITTEWLEPLKLYTAIFYNRNMVSQQRAEVHRYCFQTSRYENLEAQIDSYHRKDKEGNERDAVFALDVPLNASQIDDLWAVIDGQLLTGANTVLNEQYPDAFDRAWLGVVNMEPLPPAVGTEFNFVKTLDGNNHIQNTALLIRSDEPLNDPKIPLDVLRNTPALMISIDGQEDTSCQFIVSRDGAQILVMSSAKMFAPGELAATFRYLLWDGNNWVIIATVQTLNLNIV